MSLIIEIEPYKSSEKKDWDKFNSQAKNQSLLFFRDYMEYHSDRFKDHSLIFRHKGNIVALLPANLSDSTLYSHSGLTYGGFIVGTEMSSPLMLSVFESLREYMADNNLRTLVYKAMPYIYFKCPFQEDLYALFRNGASLVRRDVGTVVPLGNDVENHFSRLRRRGVKKALNNGIKVHKTNDYTTFMGIVGEVLHNKYSTKPVHTAQEIEKLAASFQSNIVLYGAFKDSRMVAGVLVYLSNNVAHAQYGFATEEGRNNSALDLLYRSIFLEYKGVKQYFSFGISTENEGQYLNEKLISYKESFGGYSVVSDFYRLTI